MTPPKPNRPRCRAWYENPALMIRVRCNNFAKYGEYCAVHRKVLTPDEVGIIQALIGGMTTKQIALELRKTPMQVTRKIERARRVVGAETTAQLTAMYVLQETIDGQRENIFEA